MRIAYPVLLSALLLPTLSLAQSNDTMGTMAASSQPSTNNLSAQDKSFIGAAAEAGLAEVQQGELAQSNGGPAVQALAATMVSDHKTANAQLAALAARMGDATPMSVSPADAQTMQALTPMHGATFDTKYLHGQKLAHDQAIALFKKEIADGSNERIKSFAKQTLPVLEGHLHMIEKTTA